MKNRHTPPIFCDFFTSLLKPLAADGLEDYERNLVADVLEDYYKVEEAGG